MAVFAVKFQTAAGPAFLPGVEFRILPGPSKEILIGRSELKRLKVPTRKTALAAVIKEHNNSGGAKGISGGAKGHSGGEESRSSRTRDTNGGA